MDDLFAGCERPEASANPSTEMEQRALLAAKAAKALAGKAARALPRSPPLPPTVSVYYVYMHAPVYLSLCIDIYLVA